MIVEYIRYKIDESRCDAFEKAYVKAGESLTASSQCLAYELTRCTEDAQQYILRIEWDSADGHMKGFRSSPEFKAFFSAIQPYVKDIEEMRHYELTAARAKVADLSTLRLPAVCAVQLTSGARFLFRRLRLGQPSSQNPRTAQRQLVISETHSEVGVGVQNLRRGFKNFRFRENFERNGGAGRKRVFVDLCNSHTGLFRLPA